MKSYEEKIAELKRQLEFENESWIKRFDLRNVEYKKEMERSIAYVEERCREEMVVAVEKCEEKVREVEQQKE